MCVGVGVGVCGWVCMGVCVCERERERECVKRSEIKMSNQTVIILTTGFQNFKKKHSNYTTFRKVYPSPSSGMKEITPTQYDTKNKVYH